MSSLRSDNMRVLLQLFFCLVLLATGNCLQCEKCESNSTSCMGTMENCTSKQSCVTAILLSKMEPASPFNSVMKSCGSSMPCSLPELHFDLGSGRTYRLYHSCCMEEGCSKMTPTLPPMEKDPKMKECPACYSMGGSCKKETVQCSGEDADCFTITLNKTSNGKQVQHIMKGCGSKTICQRFESFQKSIYWEVKGRIKCTLSGASQAVASFLTTFYSLWILKLLI